MSTTQKQPMRCPKCGHEEMTELEMIESWQWERPIYGCSACAATVIGQWRTTDGAVTPDIAAPAIATAAHAL